ncbi:MAG: hypothetical protein ACPG1C_04905 [Alphaproteobacteria bacterium]
MVRLEEPIARSAAADRAAGRELDESLGVYPVSMDFIYKFVGEGDAALDLLSYLEFPNLNPTLLEENDRLNAIENSKEICTNIPEMELEILQGWASSLEAMA